MGSVYAKGSGKTATAGSSIEQFVKQTGLPESPQQKLSIKDMNFETVPARVDKINVEGLGRTKNDIVEDCIRDIFKAKDFHDVLLKTHKARVKLDELGCFNNIGVYIDTSKGANATNNGLEVTFEITEFKRITGGVSTHVGNNEGSLLVGMRAPNLFGRGERFQIEYSHGSKKSSNFNVGFVKPFRGRHRSTLTMSILQANSEQINSGYKLLEKGLSVDFGFYSSSLLKHNFQWEGIIRNLSTLTRTTSFSVREQCGPTLKSAFKHILSVDLRDDFIFPNKGSLIQLTSELAGIGGNIGFLKNEIYFQDNYAIFDDIVFQTTLNFGCVAPVSKDKKITISDLCYLGGPLSLRGFENRGIGPHSDGNSLGSNTYWATGLHLFTPLPFRPGRGGFGDLFKTHFFVNAGNVANLNLENISKQDLLEILKTNVRVSYGLGLALRFGNMARLEVNYCFPLRFEKTDQIHPGIQFGIGLNFL